MVFLHLSLASLCSVHFSSSVVFDSLRPHEPQHARPPYPSSTPRVYPNPFPLSRWCHPTISSSAIPFSSCPQSFPISGSFQMNQLFVWGGQSTGVSALAPVLPMNIRDRFPLGWTGLISLLSKGLSGAFFSTTVWKHWFFSAQPSLWSNSHICTCEMLLKTSPGDLQMLSYINLRLLRWKNETTHMNINTYIL